MAYCIRYIFEGESPPSLSTFANNMRTLDEAYRLSQGEDGQGDIAHGGVLVGHAHLEAIDQPLEHPEIQLLLEELEGLAEEDDELDTDAASHRLWNATGMLTVEVAWEGDDHSASLQKLNPLWGMLLGTYPGMLYAEREAYYDADGLVLELG